MIYFNNYKVRKYLIDNKFVFTVRKNQILQGKHDLVFHCKNRGMVKFGIGECKRIDRIRKDSVKLRLKEYVEYSGFSTVANWVYVILTLNEWKSFKETIYLYRIELNSHNNKWRGLIY